MVGLVGHGDFAAQARLAFGNLGRALAAAGARPEHVCKITVYVVDYRRNEHVPIIDAAQIALFGALRLSYFSCSKCFFLIVKSYFQWSPVTLNTNSRSWFGPHNSASFSPGNAATSPV
jgi:hypothetical protein